MRKEPPCYPEYIDKVKFESFEIILNVQIEGKSFTNRANLIDEGTKKAFRKQFDYACECLYRSFVKRACEEFTDFKKDYDKFYADKHVEVIGE